MSRKGAYRMSKRKTKVSDGFMHIGDSTLEESVIARLYGMPESKRRSVVHDLANRYGIGTNGFLGDPGYYERTDAYLETARRQHLGEGEADGLPPICGMGGFGRARRPPSDPSGPPIPPPNCRYKMVRKPRKGQYCDKVSIGAEMGKPVCFHHTAKGTESQRGRNTRYQERKREEAGVDDL